jgi:glycerophosphoryl diester phosphodiesterase
MDGGNPNAATLTDYFNSIPRWRTTLSAGKGTLLTHKESIELFKSLDVMMTPELKGASVPMPFDGFTQELYAQKMIDEYKAAGVNPKKVWAQSFNHSDVRYWVKNEPSFGKQAVALEDVNVDADLVAATARLAGLKADGVKIVAPPTWALLSLDASKNIVPSTYAKTIKDAGFKIITWTLERSGPIREIATNSYYFQNVLGGLSVDGDIFVALDVLAQQVGIIGIFSDWAATVTYYANCLKLK